MKHKLSPCLYNASLKMRKNLWQIFVLPLFEFTLPIFYYEDSNTQRIQTEQLLRKSFKSFTGIGKTVETKIVEELMRYNLSVRSKQIHYISRKKWDAVSIS